MADLPDACNAGYLNNSQEECQPCGMFKQDLDDIANYYGTTHKHDCMAPIPGTSDRCATYGGTVAFCDSCHKDHHIGGYNACKGSWHTTGEFQCARNHPKCIKSLD